MRRETSEEEYPQRWMEKETRGVAERWRERSLMERVLERRERRRIRGWNIGFERSRARCVERLDK